MISQSALTELIKRDPILGDVEYTKRNRFLFLPKLVKVRTTLPTLSEAYVFGIDTEDVNSMGNAFIVALCPTHWDSDGWLYLCGYQIIEVIGCDE